MSDTVKENRPALTLADPPGKILQRQGGPGRGTGWLLGLQVVCLIGIGYQLANRSERAETTAVAGQPEQLRATALALEARSLSRAAAETWQVYLRYESATSERANLLYRIGRLYLESEEYNAAVVALVEAEQLAVDDPALQQKIGPKIVDCLRRLGRYGEVGRELSRQVEVDSAAGDRGTVLATFAGESFYEADLDRLIERTVDRALSLQGGGGLGVAREQVLKQYQSPQARQQMLQQLLQRELFSRRARDLKMDSQAEFVDNRRFLETELLANRFLTSQLENIQPTDVDLESYYAAQQATYRQPETASLTVLWYASSEEAQVQVKQITSVDDFRALVAASDTAAEMTRFEVSRGQSHPQLGDVSAVFGLEVEAWTKQPGRGAGKSWLALLESKTPARLPPLSEVRLRVAADYRLRKRQELMQDLLADLMKRYDVQILAGPQDPSASTAAETSRESQKSE
ncbi:MAG: peptidylprolyl isomerase [Planctomycetota bacterium]|nr:peptidylprolyl isomerase [Planctomycetota bacterium]